MLRGLDCSLWQGVIDWHAVKASGIAFALAKRSEGVGVIDPQFTANWDGMKAAGLCRGCYHFAVPDANSPDAESTHFLVGLPALEPGDLVALDIESGGGNQTAWALAWLQNVEKALGFAPLVYSSPDHIANHLQGKALAAYPLWLADLSRVRTNCPPWQTITLRQFSFTERVPGIVGDVDGDELDRDIAGLKLLGKPAPAPPPPPVKPVELPGETVVACSLKDAPNHTSSDVVASIPKDATIVILPWTSTTAGEVWQRIRWTSLEGWVLRANLKELEPLP